ncbi:hypothetical protein SteCoe_22901 [Stentor coeruleus]|uniref:EF-hand domain-containing protein n=1 Tax=Stentor coeruleus TaxID=5963 RepID=A0A1R2BLB5_9CILI|nr:hypothetical protein SteCoe_22901 [Stentor coeruleus]
MLSKESQKNLAELIMKIIEGENKVEILRKCLCENYEFAPYVLFKSLCKVYPDSMLPKDIKDFLQQNNEEVSDQEVYLLVRQYSSLQNGRLNEEDFSHFVLTSTNETLPSLVVQRFHVKDLRPGVKFSFMSLLKEELRLQREVEASKIKLFQDPDFSLWKAFEHLNSGGKGYISEGDFTDFIQKSGRFIGVTDYDALMRRIDLEDDLVISYNEFLEALLPLQIPGQKDKPQNSIEKSEASEKLSVQASNKNSEKPLKKDQFEQSSKDLEEELENQSRKRSQNEDPDSQSKNEGIFITEEDVNPEQDIEDKPINHKDLENSPRFNNSHEDIDENYETPEKRDSSGKKRQPQRHKTAEVTGKVGELLIVLLDNHRKLEFARQNLAIQDNFSLSQAFKIISKDESESLSPYEIHKFLEELNISCDKNVVLSLVEKLSSKNEPHIGIQELTKFVSPEDEEYKELIQLESDEPISQNTFEMFRELWDVAMINEDKLLQVYESIGEFNEEDAKEVFAAIDTDEDGEVNSEDLKHFLKIHGRNVSEKDRKTFIKSCSGESDTIYFGDFKKLLSLG